MQKKLSLLICVFIISFIALGCGNKENVRNFDDWFAGMEEGNPKDVITEKDTVNNNDNTGNTDNTDKAETGEGTVSDDAEKKDEYVPKERNNFVDVIALRDEYLNKAKSVNDYGSIQFLYLENGMEDMISSLSKSESVPQLKFNDQPLPYDSFTKSFFLPLSVYSDEWEEGEITSEGKNIVFSDRIPSDKLVAMSKTDGYLGYIFDNKSVFEFKLVLSGLPVISLNLSDGHKSDEIGDEDCNGIFRFYDANSMKNWMTTGMNATIHIRGNLSREFPKKSYKLETEEKVKLCGLRKDDDWILNAMYNEENKLRDKVTADIWNSFGASQMVEGANYGTHGEYVELFINDEYRGLYLLEEPLDEKQFDIDKVAKEGNRQEYFYLSNGWNEGIDYSDLFIDDGIERKKYWTYKNKKPLTGTEDWQPLISYLELTSVAKKELPLACKNVIDPENLTDYWLFLQAVTGVDNVAKNMMIICKNAEDGGYQYYYVPWDFNYTFGLRYDDYEKNYVVFNDDVKGVSYWAFGERYLNDNIDNAKQILKEKWDYLKGNVFSAEYINRLIDRNYYELDKSGAYLREGRRWEASSFSTDLTKLKSNVREVLMWLDECVKVKAKY